MTTSFFLAHETPSVVAVLIKLLDAISDVGADAGHLLVGHGDHDHASEDGANAEEDGDDRCDAGGHGDQV
jgi:hypothetical protein